MPGPVQHPQGAERVPAAGLVRSLGHVEIENIGMGVREPASVAAPGLLHQQGRLGDPLVRFDAGASQIVQPAQHVVVIPGNENRVQSRLITSPDDRDRNRRRSRRYAVGGIDIARIAALAPLPVGRLALEQPGTQPSEATRERSAATTSSDSSVRSRITCQRIEGSAQQPIHDDHGPGLPHFRRMMTLTLKLRHVVIIK